MIENANLTDPPIPAKHTHSHTRTFPSTVSYPLKQNMELKGLIRMYSESVEHEEKRKRNTGALKCAANKWKCKERTVD